MTIDYISSDRDPKCDPEEWDLAGQRVEEARQCFEKNQAAIARFCMQYGLDPQSDSEAFVAGLYAGWVQAIIAVRSGEVKVNG